MLNHSVKSVFLTFGWCSCIIVSIFAGRLFIFVSAGKSVCVILVRVSCFDTSRMCIVWPDGITSFSLCLFFLFLVSFSFFFLRLSLSHISGSAQSTRCAEQQKPQLLTFIVIGETSPFGPWQRQGFPLGVGGGNSGCETERCFQRKALTTFRSSCTWLTAFCTCRTCRPQCSYLDKWISGRRGSYKQNETPHPDLVLC